MVAFRLIAIAWSDVLQTYTFFIMQDYLTNVWGLSFTHAAGILNIWEGIQRILPVFFRWHVDEFSCDTTHVVLSTVSNTIGLACIAMSTPPVLANLTGTCKQYEAKCIGQTQKILFYVGMALVAVGLAGRKAVIISPKDKVQEGQERKILLGALVTIGLVIMPRILAVGLPNITLWSVRLGVPAICTAVATLFFLTDLTSFKKQERTGASPVTTVLRVFVACASKINKTLPQDVNDLYMRDQTEAQKHTQSCCLRFLEKAAIQPPDMNRRHRSIERPADIRTQDRNRRHRSIERPAAIRTQDRNRWKLCSVGEVEEVKVIIRLIPVLIPFVICGIVLSNGKTYFVEQANHLKSPPHFTVPAFLCFVELYTAFQNGSQRLTWKLQKQLIDDTVNGMIPGGRHVTPSPKMNIASGMIMSVLCCITAAKIESRRLNVVASHDLVDNPNADIPMSVFWMLLPFWLLTSVTSLLELEMEEFFEDETPESARNYVGLFIDAVLGFGFLLSVLSVYVVGLVSGSGGKQSWFQFTLNRSRLDKYYWILAVLSAVNLIAFVLAACCHSFVKCIHSETEEEEEQQREHIRTSTRRTTRGQA